MLSKKKKNRKKQKKRTNITSELPISHFSPWYPSTHPEMHGPFKIPQTFCGPRQTGSHFSEQFALYSVAMHSVVRKRAVGTVLVINVYTQF